MARNVKRIYIDASPILNHKLSGIGHLTLMMIRGLVIENAASHRYDIHLLVPARKTEYVSYWGLDDGVVVTKIPLLARIWNTIPRIPFVPPIDLFIGKGVYIFPNFKHWPVVRSRSITYIHDISFLLYPEFTEPKNLAMLSSNIGRWIDKTDRIVTDSETSKDEIIERFPPSKSKVDAIYCGVDSDLFKKEGLAKVTSVQEKYGLKKKYFMFLSSLEPRKNIENLIDGFMSMPKAYKKQYSLLLVGGMGWNNANIIEKIRHARSEGWDIIRPNVYVPDEDLPALLTGADLLVHPALHEGFGIPPIEAMSCGTPVVVSDIAVMREVCGEAAVYANPHKPSDIAKKMQLLVEDVSLRKKLIKSGSRQAQQFTWTRATESLISVINDQFRSMS